MSKWLVCVVVSLDKFHVIVVIVVIVVSILFSAKMQFGCDAYERVERSDSLFKRPLCVTGPDSDSVAELVSGKPQFNLCENFEQMLGICSQVLKLLDLH